MSKRKFMAGPSRLTSPATRQELNTGSHWRASTAEWAAKRRPTISTECSRATVPVPWPHHKFGVKPRSQLRTTPRPRGVEMGYLCSASSFDNMCIYTDRWLNRETGMKCLRHRDDAWSESCHCVQRHVSSTCIYDRQAKSCQLDVVWGTQCEAATDAASRRWTVCPRRALLKSRGLVPVNQDSRCRDDWAGNALA